MFDIFYIGKKPGLFPHEQAAESIAHAQTLSRTRYFWVVNYLVDYTGFDFLWEPKPWEATQRHAWGSVWQKDSGTYLIPKDGYTDTNYHDSKLATRTDMSRWENTDSVEQFDFSWHPDYSDPPFNYEFGTQWQKTGGPRYSMPGATDTKYLSQSGTSVRALAQYAYVIDHLDGNAEDTAQQIAQQITVAKTVRFFDNYKDTLTRLANNAPADQEYIWICGSVCDYSNFDFSWHPEAWQNHMLHVFPSDEQKFGDTFFMHVPTFKAKIREFELLDWYDINFVANRAVPRRPMPVIQHNKDSQVDVVKSVEWSGPLAVFTTQERLPKTLPTVSLWRATTRNITTLDKGGSTVIVPRDAVPYIKTQLYDYPYIDKTQQRLPTRNLDIVFLSNGEYCADFHWDLLMRGKDPMSGVLYRLDGVPGRVAAYQAAAELSQTDWFFAVFAKLQVNTDFDWTWQPDRMQEAKHYIFQAYNPVNHLVYGHQAMIAYNKRLVLENPGRGLDFTLDQPHEVVPILSGTAYYDSDPWTCWRTAFRECIKLRHSLPDVENDHRLQQWLTVGDGVNGHWSTTGARDAVDYYESVNGDFAELKKSYEWDWLAAYAVMLHPSLFTESKT